MSGLKYYRRLQYVLELIEKERTGSPAELAKKLDVTERTVYNILDSVKVMNDCKITFRKELNSYVFEKQ